MIQAIGLTGASRRYEAPAVDDLTFEARRGAVTGLLGAPGSGKSTALRLMLELEPGRGVTLFDGRPMHRIRHPAHEVGVLLGDVPGHPGRSARGHLRMLCAASGIPGSRADEVLDLVGLAGVSGGRLDTFSLGMERRLGLAAALLGDPHVLVLDEPDVGLSPRESAWAHSLLRAFAAQGGTVLVAGTDAGRMAALADHVVSIDRGRLVADQPVADFTRTRLRARVVARSPHAPRLAQLLAAQGIEVAKESGSCVGVFGSGRAHVGETAFRHGIVLHELADQIVDTGPPRPDRVTAAPGLQPSWRPWSGGRASDPGEGPEEAPPARESAWESPCAQEGADLAGTDDTDDTEDTDDTDDAEDGDGAGHPLHERARPALPGPTWLLRYEWRRLAGVRSTWLIAAAALAADLAVTVLLGSGALASHRHHDVQRVLTGWLPGFPLPPVALGAGLLGALAFGHEFRYPALAPAQVAVRRRMRLLLAKLVVSAACALLLAAVSLGVNAAVVRHGTAAVTGTLQQPLPPLLAGWGALAVGCAWTGLLAAGVFRSSLVGALCVLAVPVLAVPAVRWAAEHPALGPALDMGGHVTVSLTGAWAYPVERGAAAVGRLASGPVAYAFMLSIAGLLCAYTSLVARRRTVGRSPRKVVSF